MLKILIIYAHPDPQASQVNRLMLAQAAALSHVTVHDLYACYPDFFIDVARERQLLNAHDLIVFQHPLYMYSCPALLKEWFDVVLTKGYAHGDQAALAGKIWRSVITAGAAESAFSQSGYNRYPLEDILQPFELIAALCQMQWQPPLVLYWARKAAAATQHQHAKTYRQWLEQPLLDDQSSVEMHHE
ncbi:General stress protein 14 [Vibrio stylophorae]|uniref:General stress protein 14 n=1 Tax=Vibrio stylophorae TaxID=659351 RepID=A0ABM8ZW28_9VIBR|nr:glutathione-regulated potassium-efflux system ancillary protein KefG [Vibrio stylophorae]CAH0534549.1 General stress protein 14 [Vibrio stylophorae]